MDYRVFFEEMNKGIRERFDRAMDKIGAIGQEVNAPEPFTRYFVKVSDFMVMIEELYEAVEEGRPPPRLTRWAGKVTYVLHWTLEDGEAHARVSRLGLERFYRRWNRCLITMPKILLGEDVV